MTANSQKVMIITGASSGIGKATKDLLRMKGHIVYNLDITADPDDDPAQFISMYNVLEEIPAVEKLVQVGIRDYCDEEQDYINNSNGRVKAFYDQDIKQQLFEGAHWKHITDEVVATLPQKVYISFDIDGLDPKLCPNTGTPVPGGFESEQIFYLFKKILESGRKIIGFDLNEVGVGDNDWDANVGARVLYKLCNLLTASNN